MDEPLLLDKSGEDEADILIAYRAEDGAPKRILVERSSPLEFLYSLRDLFSKASASFWLSPGLYPFRFDIRIVRERDLTIEVHPPSFPMAEFHSRTEEDQLRLYALLEAIVDKTRRSLQTDGEASERSARIRSFYLNYLAKLLRGQIIMPPLFASTLSLEVPSIVIQVAPETYVRAVKSLADNFFERVTPEGPLEGTRHYEKYQEGISAYEVWHEGHAGASDAP